MIEYDVYRDLDVLSTKILKLDTMFTIHTIKNNICKITINNTKKNKLNGIEFASLIYIARLTLTLSTYNVITISFHKDFIKFIIKGKQLTVTINTTEDELFFKVINDESYQMVADLWNHLLKLNEAIIKAKSTCIIEN